MSKEEGRALGMLIVTESETYRRAPCAFTLLCPPELRVLPFPLSVCLPPPASPSPPRCVCKGMLCSNMLLIHGSSPCPGLSALVSSCSGFCRASQETSCPFPWGSRDLHAFLPPPRTGSSLAITPPLEE